MSRSHNEASKVTPLCAVVLMVGVWSLGAAPAAYGAGGMVDASVSKKFEIAQGQVATADLVKLGKKTSRRKGCAACHSFNGKRKPGPTWKGLYGSDRRLTTGQVVVADEEYLRRSILKPRAEIVKGWPRSSMPKNLRRKLSDKQIEAIIALIKSLR